MMVLVGIGISLLIFSIIILLHEYGHFKMARFFGVKVFEFGLGIPPKAKRLFTDKKGTEFTLNWLPLGGFVRLKGESIHTFSVYDSQKKLYNNAILEQDLGAGKTIYEKNGEAIDSQTALEILKMLQDNQASDSLLTKPYYQQALVILAGVLMNFLTAWVIFTVLFLIGVKPIGINNIIETPMKLRLIPTQEEAFAYGLLKAQSGVYMTPLADSIAMRAGIQSQDLVVSIDETPISTLQQVIERISSSKGVPLTLGIERVSKDCYVGGNDCIKTSTHITLTPSLEGKIGVSIGENIQVDKDFVFRFGLLESFTYAGQETLGQIILTFQALKKLFSNIFFPKTPNERQEAIDQVSGPIGIVGFITNNLSYGLVFLTIFAALISINLGVFNLLPIPALDGGRFLFILINSFVEKIFGKRMITQSFEGYLHIAFFLLFILLSFVIAYNDVHHIIQPK